MDNIQILIVEDDLIQAEELGKGLTKLGYQVIGIIDNKTEALKFVNQQKPDLVLTDLRLKGAHLNQDGISLGKEIKSKYSIPVIFMSTHIGLLQHDQLTEEKVIKKPILDVEELSIFISQKIKGKQTFLNTLFKDSFFIKAGKNNETIRIKYEDLLYIKAEGNLTSFNLADGKRYSLSTTLGTILRQIDYEPIIRVHNSYAINLKKITGYDNDSFLINDIAIPMRGTYFSFNTFKSSINYIYTNLSYK